MQTRRKLGVLSLSATFESFHSYQNGCQGRAGEVMIATVQRFEDKTLLAEGRTSTTRSGDFPSTGVHCRYVIRSLIPTNSKSFFISNAHFSKTFGL